MNDPATPTDPATTTDTDISIDPIELVEERPAPEALAPSVATAGADLLDPLDDLIRRLEGAAEQLRSGELSTDAAATLVDECAALANHAGAELERRARAEAQAPPPGQDSLL